MLINNNLEKYIHRFPGLLFDHTLKLSDITEKNSVVLDDDFILMYNKPFPKKFELEVVRFWRKKNLLPFFEDGKHAKISLAQLMWLRFLENLRNLSPNINVLEKAHEFFIKNAYDKNLALRNLFDLEEKLKIDIKQKPDDVDLAEMLKNVTNVMKDQLLQYSLRSDINYFNMYVMDEIINAPNSEIIFTYRMMKEFDINSGKYEEIPKFEIIKNGKIISIPGEENEDDILFDPKKEPVATFYARYFLEDIFADCNISPKAFNIQILDPKEQELFKQIRQKNLVDVIIQSLSKKIGTIHIQILDAEENFHKEGIKELKLNLGTKNYRSVIGNLKDGTKYSF
jgi:hypothetical protein